MSVPDLGQKPGLPALDVERAGTLWHRFGAKKSLRFCELSYGWAYNAFLMNEMFLSLPKVRQHQYPSELQPLAVALAFLSPRQTQLGSWRLSMLRGGCLTALFQEVCCGQPSFVLLDLKSFEQHVVNIFVPTQVLFFFLTSVHSKSDLS